MIPDVDGRIETWINVKCEKRQFFDNLLPSTIEINPVQTNCIVPVIVSDENITLSDSTLKQVFMNNRTNNHT